MNVFFCQAVEVSIMNEPFEFLEHTGDIRIGVTASSLQQLFVNSAEAMMTVIYGTDARERAGANGQEISLEVDGHDLESLLVNWLSELLLLSQINYAIVTDFQLKLMKEFKLTCKQQIYPAEAIEDIKAVTYHNLVVTEMNGLFRAEITFDI